MTLPWKGSRIGLLVAAAKGRYIRFFVCCFAVFGAVAFNFINPQIIRFTVDSVIGDMPMSIPVFAQVLVERIGGTSFLRYNIWIPALLILGTAIFSALCNSIRRYFSYDLGESVAQKIRNNLYGHIQKLSYDWHIGCQTGDIIQRCTSDVDTTRNFIQNQFIELIRVFFVIIIALVMMFSMDVFMSLMALALIPLILIFSIFYFSRVSREFNRGDIAEGVMQAAAQENYTGVRVVRAFGRESYEVDKFSEKTKIFQNIWIKVGKMLVLFWGTGDLIAGVQLAIIVGAGVYRSVQGDLSPGTFLAFYTYCNWMIWPIRSLGRILSDLSKALVATGRVVDILAVEPETDPQDAISPEIRGEIVFQNVTFKYGESEPVLKNVSFVLKPGESMAILGATGSGKSTMIHLINRLYDLEEGNGMITIDGTDIRKISRHHLRRHIGLCLQEPFLFSKNVKDNISLARPELTLDEVKGAASVAMVDDSIETFAEGYNTVIGERGVTVSGGQKQRIAIARMLAGNTPVMIFDDSLSAVDTETDAKIRAALRKRVKDAAVIIISHRISSLMQADKILVLKNGTVEDFGSHEELLRRGGTYQRIFEIQRGVDDV